LSQQTLQAEPSNDDLAERALNEHFWPTSEDVEACATALLGFPGVKQIKIHAEPAGTMPQDGSVLTVSSPEELPAKLEEAFMNAKELNPNARREDRGYIWFDI
jgi:hypothetical protein